jgi:Uma2 family endonuclease
MNSWPVLEPREPLPQRKLSVDEWLSLDEDESGELIDGALVEDEVPDFVHELTVSWLIGLLRAWLGPSGFVVGSELKLLLREGRGRKADVVVILPGAKPPPRSGPLREPPDVLVEVVTPTPRDERRDRVEKMADYAAFVVPYYWLVDPTLRAFEIFGRTSRGNYERLAAVTSGSIDPVPGCAGLVIDVDALWAELERLEASE